MSFVQNVELLTRIELVTSSLPRKCSTTELQQQIMFRLWSGRRGSNPRPPAWKASALSTELLPHVRIVSAAFLSWGSPVPRFFLADYRICIPVGKDGFEPPKACASRFTVCPIWPLWYLPFPAPRPRGLQRSVLKCLCGRLNSYPFENGCKGMYNF